MPECVYVLCFVTKIRSEAEVSIRPQHSFETFQKTATTINHSNSQRATPHQSQQRRTIATAKATAMLRVREKEHAPQPKPGRKRKPSKSLNTANNSAASTQNQFRRIRPSFSVSVSVSVSLQIALIYIKLPVGRAFPSVPTPCRKTHRRRYLAGPALE